MEMIQESMVECAESEGLYVAQDAAWLAEVNRLVQEGEEKAQPLVDWDFQGILNEPGVASFLTDRGLNWY